MANHHGDFIWYELMTPDADGARAFYGPMLGWDFGGSPEYHEIKAADADFIGGLLPLSEEMTAHGARPAWVGYVKVEDVDTMSESVEHGGGRVIMPPRDLPEAGRFAMVTDLHGAPFYVMKPKPTTDNPDAASNAFSYDKPRVGHCAWNELATDDPDAALHFYGQRFGWVKDGEMDMGPLGKYQFLRHAGRAPDGSPPGSGMIGAVMPLVPPDTHAHWMHYFRVADIDAAIAQIGANGGTVTVGPDEIPGGDFSLKGIDPQGAHFALVGARQH